MSTSKHSQFPRCSEAEPLNPNFEPFFSYQHPNQHMVLFLLRHSHRLFISLFMSPSACSSDREKKQRQAWKPRNSQARQNADDNKHAKEPEERRFVLCTRCDQCCSGGGGWGRMGKIASMLHLLSLISRGTSLSSQLMRSRRVFSLLRMMVSLMSLMVGMVFPAPTCLFVKIKLQASK
jgi:hypothetical protein